MYPWVKAIPNQHNPRHHNVFNRLTFDQAQVVDWIRGWLFDLFVFNLHQHQIIAISINIIINIIIINIIIIIISIIIVIIIIIINIIMIVTWLWSSKSLPSSPPSSPPSSSSITLSSSSRAALNIVLSDLSIKNSKRKTAWSTSYLISSINVPSSNKKLGMSGQAASRKSQSWPTIVAVAVNPNHPFHPLHHQSFMDGMDDAGATCDLERKFKCLMFSWKSFGCQIFHLKTRNLLHFLGISEGCPHAQARVLRLKHFSPGEHLDSGDHPTLPGRATPENARAHTSLVKAGTEQRNDKQGRGKEMINS